MLTPADEKFDVTPDPRLESFFQLTMLQSGDPSVGRWLLDNGIKFYGEYAEWLKWNTLSRQAAFDFPARADALLQYMVWYDNERARIDGRYNKGP